MDVHRAVLPGILVAPYQVQQLFPAVNPVGVFHQQLQQIKLPGGELHGVAVLPGGPGRTVQGQSPQGQPLVRARLPPGGGGPAQQRLDPGLDLQNIKGLCDVVSRPVLKPQELVRVLPPGGEHNDGDGGECPDLHAGLQPVQLRHHQVQNNQVVLVGPGQLHRLTAIVAHIHGISLVLQVKPDAFHHLLFIVNHQNPCHGLLLSPPPEPQRSHRGAAAPGWPPQCP